MKFEYIFIKSYKLKQMQSIKNFHIFKYVFFFQDFILKIKMYIIVHACGMFQ
jgi:hypothetical protein